MHGTWVIFKDSSTIGQKKTIGNIENEVFNYSCYGIISNFE